MTQANGNGETNLDRAWAEIRELGLESYVADLDAHGYKIPQEMLDRNPSRFAILTQQGILYGYESQDDSIARAERAGKFLAAYSQDTSGRLFDQGLYS